MIDVLKLHRDLVSIPSVSGSEEAISDFVEALLPPCERLENTLIASKGEGPILVLNSHLDTVPVQPGWTADPWTVRIEGDRVIGLGANDAKASVAAMIAAFLESEPFGFQLILVLAEGEETLGIGTQKAVAHLKASNRIPTMAVIGEPTALQSGIGQYGLAILRLAAKGQACHAAHAHALGIENPIFRLAEHLSTIGKMSFGDSSVQPTVLMGAGANNQVPAEASAVLDVRLSPGTTAEAIRALLPGDVDILSDRLISYAQPENAMNFLKIAPEPHFVSRTMSDQVWFQGIPAIKIGPGQTERSHTVDEFVYQHEVLDGLGTYRQMIQDFGELYA